MAGHAPSLPSVWKSARAPSALLAVCWLVQCAPQRSALNGETSSTLIPPPQQPASGIILSSVEASRTDTRLGFVTLREPLPPSAALATISQLCRAISAESTEELAKILAPDAWLTVQDERRPALSTWTARFARLPYQLVPCEQMLDLLHVSLSNAQASEGLSSSRALAEGADWVATVPVLRREYNGERLFGAELLVGLRRQGDEYRITGMLDL